MHNAIACLLFHYNSFFFLSIARVRVPLDGNYDGIRCFRHFSYFLVKCTLYGICVCANSFFDGNF